MPAPAKRGRLAKDSGVSKVFKKRLANTWGVECAHYPRGAPQDRRGRRAITADSALRFARYFGTSAEFWLNLQSHYDLEVEEGRAGESVAKIQPLAHT
jgi:hypothetical protein